MNQNKQKWRNAIKSLIALTRQIWTINKKLKLAKLIGENLTLFEKPFLRLWDTGSMISIIRASNLKETFPEMSKV